MKEIILKNFFQENGIEVPKNFEVKVVKLPSNLDFSQKINRAKNSNLHADMKFTFKDPFYSGLTNKFEWAKSALIITYQYKEKNEMSLTPKTGQGRIAKFAEEDFYKPLKEFSKKIETKLEKESILFTTFIDNPNHYDRMFFESSGLGWQGKSTMMLSPGIGPWILIATIYVSENFQPNKIKKFSCGSCNLCQISCPTGALDKAYQLDANKCISYWLQSPQTIPYEMRIAIGSRLYGCDECLLSCPPGQESTKVEIKSTKANIDLVEILDMSDNELLEKFYWFYIPKRDADFIRRNAIIVAANNINNSLEVKLLEKFVHFSENLKLYIIWAFWRFGKLNNLEKFIKNSNFINETYINEIQKLKMMKLEAL